MPNAFELLGFDILIDADLRPWLIEVNANPSVSGSSIVDHMVKKPLLHAMFEMLHLRPPLMTEELENKSEPTQLLHRFPRLQPLRRLTQPEQLLNRKKPERTRKAIIAELHAQKRNQFTAAFVSV